MAVHEEILTGAQAFGRRPGCPLRPQKSLGGQSRDKEPKAKSHPREGKQRKTKRRQGVQEPGKSTNMKEPKHSVRATHMKGDKPETRSPRTLRDAYMRDKEPKNPARATHEGRQSGDKDLSPELPMK